MDIIRAIDTIENDRYGREAYHEMLADLGSSYFMGGAQGNGGYDALTLARNDLGPAPSDEDSPEVIEAGQIVDFYESIAPDPEPVPELPLSDRGFRLPPFDAPAPSPEAAAAWIEHKCAQARAGEVDISPDDEARAEYRHEVRSGLWAPLD